MNRKEFERVSPESVGIPSAAVERLLDALESGFTEMHGLMLMRHGKVCAEGWWAPYGPGVRHGCQSLSKTYTATAVGIAVGEGLLSLDDRLIDFFPDEAPENPSENLKAMRIRDMLCMGSGMESTPPVTKDWIREYLANPIVHKPGTAFWYNNTNTTLLAAVLRKKTGVGLHDFLKPRLFEKLGIDADNMRWMYMPGGVEIGAGGLFSATEDNLRLMKLYSQGGVWEGERILPENYVRLATSKQNDNSAQKMDPAESRDSFLGYGFQLWMCRPKGSYRADGAMGQYGIVLPEQDMVIAINQTSLRPQKTLDALWDILLPEVQPDALPPDEAAWKKLKHRLDTLAIARPAYKPYSKTIAAINGKTYRVTKGELKLRLKNIMAPQEADSRTTEFRFDFTPMACKLTVQEAGKNLVLDVGVDGVRRRNVVPPLHTAATELYLSGSWVAENQFDLIERWAETCFETAHRFEFRDGKATILYRYTVGGADILMDENDRAPVTAEAL